LDAKNCFIFDGEEMLDKVIKILKHKDREDLASLLQNSYSKIEQSNTFGSYLYSIVSTLEIYSPYKGQKTGQSGKASMKWIDTPKASPRGAI
jgi:hypothetical protein